MDIKWLLASLFVVVGCSGSEGADASSDATSRALSAATTSPICGEASAWDPAKLDELASFAAANGTKALVLYDGAEPILERYFAGADPTYTRDVYSVQKSVTSVLAGIAMDRGLMTLDDSVTSILGVGWSNAPVLRESKIDVSHLLSMTSGLDLNLGYAAPPGSAWLYNDDAFYRVRLVLEKVTGRSMDALAHDWLFDPLGMDNSGFRTRLTRDSKGLFIVGLESSARDLARFGRMLRAHGRWKGQPIVSSAYLDQATSTSQSLNASYGFLFWLNGKSGGLLPPSAPFTGPLIPAAPVDTFAALGKGDQKVYVARSLDLVLVRIGDDAGDSRSALSSFDQQLWLRVMAARLK